MATVSPKTARQIASLLGKLWKAERSGRYSEGIELAAKYWPEPSELPIVDGLDQKTAAEFILRCGSLLGYSAYLAQDKDSQFIARDLVSAALSRFESLDYSEKCAECENHLALTYWRLGEHREAQVMLDASIERKLPDTNDIRLHSQIIQCLVNMHFKKNAESLAGLKSLEKAFLASKDNCLVGDYFNHCGIVLDNLGHKQEALDHFEFARFYHQRSGHRSYLASVENNLAWLYKEVGDFVKAQRSVDNAIRLFHSAKDKPREGFTYDTKALLYFEEKRYVEALKAIEKGHAILRESEDGSYLSEVLITKAKILLYLDNFMEAVICVVEAVNLARKQSGEDLARRLSSDFERCFKEKVSGTAKDDQPLPSLDTSSKELELLIPPSIGDYAGYSGVWIHNSRLESLGLKKGSLAIVGKCEVKRGELAAVTEIESGEVVCGLYDNDFGVVCLDSPEGDPEIFDAKQVRVLGKIVGVCIQSERHNGGLKVEPLNV